MSPMHNGSCLMLCLLAVAPTVIAAPPADRRPPPSGSPRADRYGDPLPNGAIARLGTIRLRPGGERWYAQYNSFALALSPDGKILATGEGGNVCFWDVTTGKELRCVSVGDSVVAVMFSPDGKLFAAHTDDTDISGPPHDEHSIQVGEVASGKVLHQLVESRQDYGCRGMTFSPDGTMLAAFRDAKPEREPRNMVFILWDVRTGKELRQLKDVPSAVFTPSSKTLVVGKKDGVIQILDLGTGRPIRRLEGHRAAVDVLAVSPDGCTLVSADTGQLNPSDYKETRTSVRLWDLGTGKVRRRWRDHEGTVEALRFSPDGRTVAVEDRRGNLFLYDTASGKLRQRFPADSPTRSDELSYAFSPDGKVLLLHEKGGPFREWDLARGEERRRWGRQGSVARMSYSPEGGPREGSFARMIYSADGRVLVSRGEDGLFVWDVAAGKELHPFAGHRTPVEALAFSPDGRLVASLDESRVLGLWEAGTGKPLLPMPPEKSEAVLGFRFARDGSILSAVGSDATVRVWDLANGLKERQFRVGTAETVRAWEGRGPMDRWWLYPDGAPGPGIAYSPDGKTLAVAGADSAIHLWGLAAGKEVRVLHGHQGQFGLLLFSPDGKLLVSEGKDWTIRLWDVRTGKELEHFPGSENETVHLLFSPDSKVLAWGCGKSLHLWDVAARKELRRFTITGDGEGPPVAFLRNDKTLAVAGPGEVEVWDLTTGTRLRRLTGDDWREDDSVRLFHFLDGTVLAAAAPGDFPWKHKFLDVRTGRRLKALSLSSRMRISPDGRALTQADDSDDSLRVVEMLSGGVAGTIASGHRGEVTALAFSADGKLLATGGSEGSILVWDWRRACGLLPDGKEKAGARELERAWQELGDDSAKTACRSVGTLAAAGDAAVAWLDRHLEAVTDRDREAIRRLIAALDDDRFAERARAGKALEQLGAEAEPMLRQALADRLSPEARRRVEALLSGPDIRRWSRQALRKFRAVDVLEQIGTARARAVLAKLARGIPEARLTQEAAAALGRLARQHGPTNPMRSGDAQLGRESTGRG